MKKLIKLLALAYTLGVMLQPSALNAQWTRNAATSQTYLTNTADNVGIGTTNPLFKLDIQSTTAASMSFKSTTGNSNVIIDRANSSSTSGVNYRTNGVPFWQTGTIGTDNFAIRNVTLGSPALSCNYLTNNVGIGTTAPAYKLDVNGTGNFTGTLKVGTYTLPIVDGTSGQVLKTNGTGTLAWSSDNGTSYIAGTGISLSGTTINSVWTASGNDIFNNNSANIGIGTSTPLTKLTVSGSESTVHGKAAAIQISNTASGGKNWFIRTGATGTGTPKGGLSIADDQFYRMAIDTNGNVGFGTLLPAYKLDVAGTGRFTGALKVGAYTLPIVDGTSGQVLKTNGAGALTWSGDNGTSYTAGTGISISGTTINSAWTASGNNIYNNNTANIGIGTSSPSEKLDVAGNIRLNNNLIYLGATGNNNYTLGYAADVDGPAILGFNGGGLGTTGLPYSLTWDFIGNATVRNDFYVGHNLVIDTGSHNTGGLDYLIRFGSGGSGEAIGSKRNAGGNQYGLDFWSGNANQMSITNSGNVGIGTSAPATKLHVYKSSSAQAPDVNANLVVESNTHNYINLLTPVNSENGILFGLTGNAESGGIIYNAASPLTKKGFQFRTGGNATRVVIDSTGNVGIGTTAPGSKLEINQNNANTKSLYVTNNSTSYNNPTAWFINNNAGPVARFEGGGSSILEASLTAYNNTGGPAIYAYGKVGINTNPTYDLDVCGTIRGKEVRVETGWCDYVFANDYKLRPLSEVESFIKENKHLPDVTSGNEIESNGLELGKTSAQMIKKIEELTLYVIELQKQVDALKNNNK